MKVLENVALAVAFIAGCIAFGLMIDAPGPPSGWGVAIATFVVLFSVFRWAVR